MRHRLLDAYIAEVGSPEKPRWRNKRAKDYRLYNEIGGFLQIFPSLCFETHPIKFYGKEKHHAKILSIYLSKSNEKSPNYPSIKGHVKWSLGMGD